MANEREREKRKHTCGLKLKLDFCKRAKGSGVCERVCYFDKMMR